ncbi:catalase [Pseudomonas sp. NPDC086278]|uniref:catalase n=1 Tax=Pseudomonas sp. NPDC086278 TaxID=3390646 RepID=UPI003D005B8C
MHRESSQGSNILQPQVDAKVYDQDCSYMTNDFIAHINKGDIAPWELYGQQFNNQELYKFDVDPLAVIRICQVLCVAKLDKWLNRCSANVFQESGKVVMASSKTLFPRHFYRGRLYPAHSCVALIRSS